MSEHVTNILICGLGGQGILTASEICARAAMKAGYHVKKSEIHGMSQRGGSVESHVRFGAFVESPLMVSGSADYLLAFDEGEGARMAYYLKVDGVDLTAELSRARESIDDIRYLNTYLTGLLSIHIAFEESVWVSALRETVRKRPAENEAAFLAARNTVSHR